MGWVIASVIIIVGLFTLITIALGPTMLWVLGFGLVSAGIVYVFYKAIEYWDNR